jgi:hypothetical protein
MSSAYSRTFRRLWYKGDRDRWSGESPVLAQRAASKGPRWTRAVEDSPDHLLERDELGGGWINHCQTISVGRGKSVDTPPACLLS